MLTHETYVSGEASFQGSEGKRLEDGFSTWLKNRVYDDVSFVKPGS